MKSIATCLAFLLMLLVTAASSQAEDRVIKIAGDPCSVPLARKLVEAYSQKNKAFKAEVSSYPCTLGVYKAADNEADIGVSTQNGLSSNLPQGAVNTVPARSPIVLVVNRSNPVDNITYKQLKSIFSGKIRNWKEAGGPDMEIRNVMLAPCVKHTMGKQVALYGDSINTIVPEGKVNPIEHTNKLVSESPGAIGQQIYGYQSEAVKVLKVNGVLPDETTLGKGYTFYQDFNMVTSGAPTGEVKGFIDFALSQEGRLIIKGMGHVPPKEPADLSR